MKYNDIMADAVNVLERYFPGAEVIDITKITIIPEYTEKTQYGPVSHVAKIVYEGTVTLRLEKIEFLIKVEM